MTTKALCVYCRHRPVESEWRPFCSERCKLLDLRNWTDERYNVQDDTKSSFLSQNDDPNERWVNDTDSVSDG